MSVFTPLGLSWLLFWPRTLIFLTNVVVMTSFGPNFPIAGCWVKIAAHSSYFICGALPAAPVISLDYNKKLEILSGIKFSLHPFSLELYRYNNKALRHERSSRVKLCNYFIQILVIFISQDNHSSLYWIPNIIIITEHLLKVLLSFPLNAEKLHI